MSKNKKRLDPSQKPSRESYFRLLRYLAPVKWHFAISLFGFAVFAASQPMLAKFFETVITALEEKNPEAQFMLPAIAVGIFIIRGAGSFLGNYYNDFVGASVVRQLQREFFEQLLLLPTEFFDQNHQGKILHRLNSATSQVKRAVTDALKTLIREGLTVIALLSYAFYLNWKLSLVFLLAAPALAIVVSYTSKRFKSIIKTHEKAAGNVLQASKEAVSNYTVVRTYGAEQYENQKFGKALNQAFKAQMKIRRTAAIYTPVTQLIVAVAIAGVVFLLLAPSSLQSYTTAQLIGYLTAIALLPKPMRQLSGVNIAIQRGLVGAEMVFDVLDKDTEFNPGTYAPEHIRGEIELRNLSFTYPNAKKPALEKLNLTIEAGKTTALVGMSGSGKTTLARLLYRTYPVPEGSIFIDGVDIMQYELRSLRTFFAIVDQNIHLFNDTLRRNIDYGEHRHSDEELQSAIESARANHFIDELPQKLETNVGESGKMLSGGQRQRVAIARAFLKDTTILIMDEATSALDNHSERHIKDATTDISSQKTTLIIAHRLSTIQNADKIVVMDGGHIVESGQHQDLIAMGGKYAELFQEPDYQDSQSSTNEASIK